MAIRELTTTPEDYGFFGPGSPTWKVWTSPTALVGFQRSVVLEHFDPDLTAAVADQRGIYTDPVGRLDRTLAYFLTVAVADGRTAVEASDFLMKVHAKATGIEPVSGKRYSANNPASQLWIHVTGWHSVLKCYEKYGPGPLTPDEERRYWAESVLAAELQTCKPSDVPASRDDVRDYFATVRPALCTSERANEGMHYLLRVPRGKGSARFWWASRFMAPATIATLPKWMRELGGFDQPGVLDRAVVPAARLAVRASSSPKAKLAILSGALPMTRRTLAAHVRAEPPVRAETVTPAQVRERLEASRVSPAK
ncbi:oxygenase MpaB family protein [Amycolatopsis minnesotensis]